MSSLTTGSLPLTGPPTRPHLCSSAQKWKRCQQRRQRRWRTSATLTCPAVSHSCSLTGLPSTTTITGDRDRVLVRTAQATRQRTEWDLLGGSEVTCEVVEGSGDVVGGVAIGGVADHQAGLPHRPIPHQDAVDPLLGRRSGSPPFHAQREVLQAAGRHRWGVPNARRRDVPSSHRLGQAARRLVPAGLGKHGCGSGSERPRPPLGIGAPCEAGWRWEEETEEEPELLIGRLPPSAVRSLERQLKFQGFPVKPANPPGP